MGELVDFVKHPVEGFNNMGEELARWRDKVRNLNPAGVSEELWGEGGRFAYPAAAAIMSKRSPTGEPLSDIYKASLRSFYGDLVERATLHWGTTPLDEWAADNFSISMENTDTEAQTYGYDIYIRFGAGENGPEYDLSTLAHELVHTQQFEKYDRSYSNFGYQYFKKYKQANLNYAANEMEVEAYNRTAEVEGKAFAIYKQKKLEEGKAIALPGSTWSGRCAMTALGDQLYVIGEGKLWSVNPGNGTATPLPGSTWSGDVALTALGGQLYVIGEGKLWSVSPGNGAATGLPKSSWSGRCAMTALGDQLYVIGEGKLWSVSPGNGAAAGLPKSSWSGDVALTALGGQLHVIGEGKLWSVSPGNGAATALPGSSWSGDVALTALGGQLYVIGEGKLWRLQF